MLKRRPQASALLCALIYFLPVASYVGYIWWDTKPQYHGLDWMFVGYLTLPMCAMADMWLPNRLPMPVDSLIGLVFNATVIYALVRAAGRLREL